MAIVLDKYTDLEDGWKRVLESENLSATFFKQIKTMSIEKLFLGRETFDDIRYPCVYISASESDSISEQETTRKNMYFIPLVNIGWVKAREYQEARVLAREAVHVLETLAWRQIDSDNDFDGWCGFTQSVASDIDEPNQDTKDKLFTCRFRVDITAWNIYDVDA